MQTKTKAARFIRNTWMVFPLSLVGIYGFMSFYGFFSLMATHKWVDHTHVVISSATEIEKLIVDLEAAERGFLITGDEQFLKPYHIADQQLNKQIEALKTRVSDNPPQVKTLESIENLLESWFEQVAKHEISVRKEIAASTIDADHLQSELKKEAGKKILDRIDKNLEALNAMFQKAEHSQAITTAQALENTVLNMITAQRNFLLTGVESALSPYESGKKSIPDQIESLHQLIDRAPNKTLARQNIASLQSHLTATLPQQSENPKPTAGMLSSDELNKAHQALNRVLEQFSGSGHEKASLAAVQIKNLLTAEDINISHINLQLSTLTAFIENTYAPNQARRHLSRINTLATEWITQSADLEITLRRRSDNHIIGTNAAVALLEIGVGKEIMDNMKALLQSFKAAEYKLMAHRKSKAKHDAIQSLTILAIGALLIFALALIVLRVSFRLKRNSKNLEAESVKLRESESISRNIVNTSLDSILTINTKGRILSCNAAVERVFGYATSELLGRNINILMPDQIANEHDRYRSSS